MLTLKTTTKFRKDYKKIKKRGLDVSLLEKIIQDLLEEKTLDRKYNDHALTCNYLENVIYSQIGSFYTLSIKMN